jgi:hypothetical protein
MVAVWIMNIHCFGDDDDDEEEEYQNISEN